MYSQLMVPPRKWLPRTRWPEHSSAMARRTRLLPDLSMTPIPTAVCENQMSDEVVVSGQASCGYQSLVSFIQDMSHLYYPDIRHQLLPLPLRPYNWNICNYMLKFANMLIKTRIAHFIRNKGITHILSGWSRLSREGVPHKTSDWATFSLNPQTYLFTD